MSTLEQRPWRRGDADSRCQQCGYRYEPWFTDHWLWNRVVGGPEATSDPGGFLCSRCFARRAAALWPNLVWRFHPEWTAPTDPAPTAADAAEREAQDGSR